MALQYALETQEVGGKRSLIVTPPESAPESAPILEFNTETFQGISISTEKADAKRDAEQAKVKEQLKRAEEIGDEVAVGKLQNQLRFGGGEHIADQIIKYVNTFFEMAAPEVSDIFYQYLYDAQTAIFNLTSENNSDTSKELTALTTAMMNKTHLADKLIKFTEYLKVPLPDPSQIGNRSHHSASKTFSVRDPQQPDYLHMTAMAFFAKLMFPVWGEYCQKMKTVGIGSIDKEFYCLQFCEQGIEQSAFKRIYNKFKDYVYAEVRKELDKKAHHSYGNETNYNKNQFILAKNGYDDTRFFFLQFSKLLTKRIVTFNTQVSSLKGEDNIPNIMIFLQAIIKKNVANTLRQFNARSGLLTRDEPRGGDDDNYTYMEYLSRMSKFPPDYPFYIRWGTELSIPREIERQGLSMDDFNALVEFYRGKNLPRKNVFTDSILSIFMFPIIGSSVNLNHLQVHQYVMALSMCQMILLKSPRAYGVPLALMLSSKTSVHVRENKIDPTTMYIQSMAEKIPEYKELMDRYPHSCETVVLNESIIGSKPKGEKKDKIKGTINIAKHIDVIKAWVIDYEHYVNLCPLLWKYFPPTEESPRQKQNDILQYSDRIMEHYYNFILDVCHPVGPTAPKDPEFWKEVGR